MFSSRLRALNSSIGQKLLIGTTGFLLFLYLIVHIAGNLMVFGGPDFFNEYSHTLLSNPLIVPIEIGLLLIFLLHIYKTVAMYLANQKARPAKYVTRKRAGPPSRKTFASTTMILSGLWLLMFVIIHVRTFKYGADYERGGMRDLYRVEMENFHSPFAVLFYLVSLLLVGSHLWHGVSSSMQSLGIDHPRWTPRILTIGRAAAVLISGGFLVILFWAHVMARQPH
jgi:succinate dehydrogenase / fumarate reductase, cytochrome b subunit